MRGLFVTGTDTGVGKTVVAAAMAAALRAGGARVAAVKPVLTGTDEPPGEWPGDDVMLATATGATPDAVAPLRFGPAVSPHLAARLAGKTIDPRELVHVARAAGEGSDVVIVEGVGGLLVPLTEDFSVRDLAAALGLPLVVAARPGLGTINHTLLTIEAARAAGLGVRAVVLTPWPGSPSPIELSNRESIARLGDVEVAVLDRIERPEIQALEDAGASLPIESWLGH